MAVNEIVSEISVSRPCSFAGSRKITTVQNKGNFVTQGMFCYSP